MGSKRKRGRSPGRRDGSGRFIGHEDYYQLLGVPKGESDPEALKKAYRKQAMKFHPDKNRDNRDAAEKRFKEISEAYEVLTDPDKRGVYERHGEEGLKAGMGRGGGGGGAPPGAGGGGGGFPGDGGFPGGGGGRGASQSRRPEDNFTKQESESFDEAAERTARERGGMGGGGGGSVPCRPPPAPAPPPAPPPQDPPIERPLDCTLEELYGGTTRAARINRRVLYSDGEYRREVRFVQIHVAPGWIRGTRVTFPRMGDERPGRTPADVVFVVEETPHARFRREGDDLVLLPEQEISLYSALCGAWVSVERLDGSTLDFDTGGGVVRPGAVWTLDGEGMPVSGQPGARGSLKVRFGVQFPRFRLTDAQKMHVWEALGD